MSSSSAVFNSQKQLHLLVSRANCAYTGGARKHSSVRAAREEAGRAAWLQILGCAPGMPRGCAAAACRQGIPLQ